MDNEEKDKFLLRLEEAGESQVRVNIASNVYGQHPKPKFAWANEWVRLKDVERAGESENRYARLAVSSTKATWIAAFAVLAAVAVGVANLIYGGG